jgi:hypothetical protein
MPAPTALHLTEVHPLDGALAVVTFLLGAVGLTLVTFGGQTADRTGLVLGAVGTLAGLWGQLVSRTRPERFVDVIGLVAAALALALGLAFGHLS